MQETYQKHNIEIGDKIYKKRVELKLSQSGLAQKAGISQSRISELELGHKSATIDELLNLSRELSINTNDLWPFAGSTTYNNNSFDNSNCFNGSITIALPEKIVHKIEQAINKVFKD